MTPQPKQRSVVLLIFAIAIVVTSAIGCRKTNNKPGESTLERIKRQKTVRIAYANEAPFGYKNVESGRVTGEAPEVARVILQRMGVEHCETTLTDFGQLIPGLKAGRFDIIAAGMYVTPERCKQIAFSNPTYAIGEAFLVKSGNPLGLHSYEDVVKNNEARLGVVGGTVELGYAEALEIPEKRISVYPDNAAALAALKSGRIDAFAGTALTVKDLLKKSPGAALERALPFQQPAPDGRAKNYGAMGFRKEDTKLRDEFNRQLAEFIGTKQHLDLVRPFGFGQSELPGSVASEELCSGSPAAP
jgi:polar amino acid transport system substrate-binding protein